jgi:hypothetical protein
MATTPVYFELNCWFPEQTDVSTTDNMGDWPASYQVPMAKRLVVQGLSAMAIIPQGQRIYGYVVADPSDHFMQAPLQFQATIRALDGAGDRREDRFSVNAAVCAYFEAGSILRAEARRDGSAGSGNFAVTLEGVLEDV